MGVARPMIDVAKSYYEFKPGHAAHRTAGQAVTCTQQGTAAKVSRHKHNSTRDVRSHDVFINAPCDSQLSKADSKTDSTSDGTAPGLQGLDLLDKLSCASANVSILYPRELKTSFTNGVGNDKGPIGQNQTIKQCIWTKSVASSLPALAIDLRY